MPRPIRLTWLLLLVAVVPIVLIGVLAYQWLSLKRESAARHGVDGARAAIASLRTAIDAHFVVLANETARQLKSRAISTGSLSERSGLPPMVRDGFLVDRDGRSLDLSAATPEMSARASELVAAGRAATSAGRLDECDRAAAQIIACCAASRDEYGMPFTLYSAWQRVTAALQTPNPEIRLTRTAQDLRALIDHGYLGTAGDVGQIRALAARVNGRGGMNDLLPAVDHAGAVAARRSGLARAGVEWLGRWNVSERRDAVRFGVIAPVDAPVLVAAADVGDAERILLVIDPEAVETWVRHWSAAHAAFDLTFRRVDAEAFALGETDARLTEGRVDDLSWVLSARPRADDPASEWRRERLFLGAIGAAMLLTLGMGFLAARDVSRELRLAALQSAFVAGVTHELKTPLTSIRLLAETLQQGRAKPERTAALLDTVVNEAERVTRMVDNVLSSSQIATGALVYSRQLTPVQDAVSTAIGRFEYVLQAEGFRVDRSFDAVPLFAVLDRNALEQAVLNLLGNAVKYAREGATRTIRVGVSRQGGDVEISIADEGIGIESRDQARIFDRFYRAPAAGAHTTGAGLGLSLVKHFAEAHDGRVSVASEPGGGSTFGIWLPLASD